MPITDIDFRNGRILWGWNKFGEEFFQRDALLQAVVRDCVHDSLCFSWIALTIKEAQQGTIGNVEHLGHGFFVGKMAFQ